MLTGRSLKYLCAVLNSKVVTWFMRNNALSSGLGTARWVRFTVEQIPVPIIDVAQQQLFIQVVDEILNPTCSARSTEHCEEVIDGLVCELYTLTALEIEAIAGEGLAKEHQGADSSTADTSRGDSP